MANLIKKDESVEKALKIELPDGTEGEIPIQDATERGQIISGDMVYKEGGEIKEYDQGEKVRKGWVKDYEDRFKTKEELKAEERKKAKMQMSATRKNRNSNFRKKQMEDSKKLREDMERKHRELERRERREKRRYERLKTLGKSMFEKK